ncbi:MAG TPA: helix-hairpin-helix domain-containing protein [Xanthomonadaceae bacterium]|jgi:competence ComEA-like helix-hairpin-helix protein|nr:helix-hairpin-helix domain-containing protein [Xanthomonadaceae bacterium]
MNKVTAMLQTLALSLLLIGSAHATSKSASVSNDTSAAATSTASHAKHAGAATHAKKKTAQKVNVNTADAEAIHQALINIGPSKAAAIVAYRKEHGAFRSADQLTQVKGIGLKTIEKNRAYIVTGSVASASAPTARH